MPSQSVEHVTVRARMVGFLVLALLLSVACFASQLQGLGNDEAALSEEGALQTRFQARKTSPLFSLSGHLSDVKLAIVKEVSSPLADDHAADQSLSMLDEDSAASFSTLTDEFHPEWSIDNPPPRSNTRAYRLWWKWKNAQKLQEEVMPLEREAKAAETFVGQVEKDVAEAAGFEKPKFKPYHRECNIFSGEGCDDWEEPEKTEQQDRDEGKDGEGTEGGASETSGASGSVGENAGASEGNSGETEGNPGASGEVAGASGGDAGASGGDAGASTGDAGASGGDDGASGGDAGASGGDEGASGGDEGASGGDAGASDQQSGAEGGDAGASSNDGGADGGDGKEADEAGLWWEDGNPDTAGVNLTPVTSSKADGAVPLFFDDDGSTLSQKDVAEAMMKADNLTRASTPGSANLTVANLTVANLTAEDKDILKSVKHCSLDDVEPHRGTIEQKGSPTHVSVGIFVINLDHRRSKQKTSAARGEPAFFFLDFLISISQPAGSTLDDAAVWDTLSFRNAKEVFASDELPDFPSTRRIKASFYYDPDLRMYPVDKQELEVRVQQTKMTASEWVFVPSSELNGISTSVSDLRRKPCSAHMYNEVMDGKEYSNYAFRIQVHKPRWFAITTGFIPPMLILSPVFLAHTLGPMSWYQFRFMVSAGSMVTIAFFYDSYLRQMPILEYLTAFDKYIYCVYLWLIATVVSLAMLVHIFRDWADEDTEHGSSKRFLSVELRDDQLHFCEFASVVWGVALAVMYILWVWCFASMFFTICAATIFYFWWLWHSYQRLHRKHENIQESGFGRTKSQHEMEMARITRAKGRSFHWELFFFCCYQPFQDLCLQECCCCFLPADAGGDDYGNGAPYSNAGPEGPCAVCKKEGCKECIGGQAKDPSACSEDPAPVSTFV